MFTKHEFTPGGYDNFPFNGKSTEKDRNVKRPKQARGPVGHWSRWSALSWPFTLAIQYMPGRLIPLYNYLIQWVASFFTKRPWEAVAMLQIHEAVLVPELGFSWLLEQTDSASFPQKATYFSSGRSLWMGGYFGKGTLSRDILSWWRREVTPIVRMNDAPNDLNQQDSEISSLYKETVNLLRLNPDQDPERYQLSSEETLYLAHLGTLRVRKGNVENTHYTVEDLWNLLQKIQTPLIVPAEESVIGQYNFAARFAAYHYFRHNGWIVRSGLKFGADFMLYKSGPSYRHSDFAVIVIPTLDPKARTMPSWHWILSLNRVNSQVKKRILLCFVRMPDQSIPQHPLRAWLRNVHVTSIIIDRWLPQLTR